MIETTAPDVAQTSYISFFREVSIQSDRRAAIPTLSMLYGLKASQGLSVLTRNNIKLVHHQSRLSA